MQTEENGVRPLSPAKEIWLRVELNELYVEHQPALTITLELLEALPCIVEAHEEVLVGLDFLDQDTFALLFILCGLLLLVGIDLFEGAIASDQTPNLIRRVVVEQKVARTGDVANELIVVVSLRWKVLLL